MPRKRRSPSPIADDLPPDDDDDAYTNEELSPNSNRCPPQQRNAANARERARMRVLSKAFCRLKTTLPWVPADTKLSKLDTLRLASGYIAHLRTLLDDQPSQESQLQGAPLNLSWPFTFQHGGGQAAWAPQQGSPNRGTPPRASLPPPQQNQPSPGPPDQQVFSCYQRQFTHGQNYYTQIQRDSGFMRHAYSDSLLHTG